MIPRLSPWSSSPPPGATSTRKRSTIAATFTSDCPTPTVSTRTTSKPAASQSRSASRVRRCHAAEGAAGGGRPDEGEGRARELLHARLVAEDRAAATRARRVDGQHRDPVLLLDQVAAERLDERRLARAGRAGDAHPRRVADVREHLGEQRLRLGAVVGARRLHQCDRARAARADHRRSPAWPAHSCRSPARRHSAHADPLSVLRTGPLCSTFGNRSVASRDTRLAATPLMCRRGYERCRGQARRSRLTISAAASGMLVPGPKIAATPASRSSS